MNYELITGLFASCREYRDLAEALETPYGRSKWRPCLAQGLPEGAYRVFLSALGADSVRGIGGYNRLLAVFSDDREAARSAEFLENAGLPAKFYPARDLNFSNMTASHDFEHERLRVLSTLLLTDAPIIVCTTAEAALQPTVPEDTLEELTEIVTEDTPIDTEALSKKLIRSGYARVDLVDGVGQFAVRGGIVDIYPPSERPVRLELFGDEIDRMGYFDVLTQRFLEPCDMILIPPVRETVMSEDARLRVKEVIEKQLKKSSKQGSALSTELLRSEMAALDNTATPDFSDKYIGVIFSEKRTLLSYFDGIVAVRDTTLCEERVRACGELLKNTMEEMTLNCEMTFPKDSFPYLDDITSLWEKSEAVPAVFADVFNKSYHGIAVGSIFDFSAQGKTGYSSNVKDLAEELFPLTDHGYVTVVLCANENEKKNLFKALFEEGFSPVTADEMTSEELLSASDGKRGCVALVCGSMSECFEYEKGKIAVLDFSSDRTGGRGASKITKARKKRKNTRAILDCHDLEVGDYVVHENYGIGLYEGIRTLTVGGVTRDYIDIRYAGTDKLFLPVDQLDLVSKYIGKGDDSETVKLSKMGGADWNKTKARAKKATKDMARELITLYAKRKSTQGIRFERDDAFSRQFADAFEFEETDSQNAAIADITRDMERPYPMDRMICGDVGYGKTEVAMRAAFKAVMSGYQVAILVPTTILALQHFRTVLSRFRGFPVSVDMLSRFRTPQQRQASLRKLARGESDIVIGTHRLISKDVSFKKLGLIIIDEEQRFGVAQKEKLKQIAVGADVLTLTATPIPRTLNMAMGGIIDMSVLDDVPGLRSPVQTYVMEHDDEVLTEAMRRELRRGGQVFYLHNRVESIYRVAERITNALPDARVAVAHGKMEKNQIEDIWTSLVRGEVDILVSTTIIETGVDVPNANTLIIDHADRYGLSQLHQIRGRVGRSSRKAYAYFTYPPAKTLSEVAEKRLRAVKEYASFGAGFKIAVRDLEIRGAGNLLGAEQHGHLDTVGYDMYVKLLSEAVAEETGQPVEKTRECSVSLRADAFIPKNYIAHSGQRMEMYKKVAKITDEEDFDDVIDEFCDRFGDIPSSVLSLCEISFVRALGIASHVVKIEQKENDLLIYPEKPDPFILSEVMGSFPKGSGRLNLTGECNISFRMKPSAKVTELAVTVMKKYSAVFKAANAETAEKAENTADPSQVGGTDENS